MALGEELRKVSGNFKKAAVIGTGLMGGSLAMALKEHDQIETVVGYDISLETRKKAVDLRIADVISDTPQEAVSGCDLVFLATTVGAVFDAFSTIRDELEPGAVVSDIASVKLGITGKIEENLPPDVYYIGGHPMTGSEQSGVESSRSDLFNACYYILTPTKNTDADAFGKMHRLISELGARVISMEPGLHDRAASTISHIPHVLSVLLMDHAIKANEEVKNLFTIAAGGFRDMTRLAASNPALWVDIATQNRDFIVEGLRGMGSSIDELVDMLMSDDRDSLMNLFMEARRGRLELALSAGRAIEEIYEISLAVPDKPGVISEISTAVGSLGINIEDIEIVHPLVGESGILNLKIDGRENADKVVEHLNGLGYRATVRGV
ncbi:MAG: prephenate dehydrogenase/arogenate dehydrogenase family protein [Actinobacteria bacterium]|nr:prephenate dehydrogenase/arogenate dehydrogenase family protein [Actinomycetota bacterium]